MKAAPIDPGLFVQNRARLRALLPPGSLAILHANDPLPTNADGVMPFHPNSDLFYLSGINQEESILVLFPDADDEKHREILFVRETSELLATWEGHKLTKEQAAQASGIAQVKWVSEFRSLLHQLMCECAHVYLNSNEHRRAAVEVETRDARFIADMQERYPLHDYRRLAPLMHQLRLVKSPLEIELIRRACGITRDGFKRVLRLIKPGVNEAEIEAEFAHEFIRQRASFAYLPIIAAGENACILHYIENDKPCRKGDLVLLDVGASHANYNADMTRTVPVSGRFTRRQKKVYQAVLRILRATTAAMRPGKLLKELRQECDAFTEKELVDLGLLRMADIRKQDPDKPALRKFFMHGPAHPLGLDVHDVGSPSQPMQPGWILTCEPAIYLKEEGFGIRLENDILITEEGHADLMVDIPIEPDEIEAAMG